MFKMYFKAFGKFFAKYFVVFVFSYGKNNTAIDPGLGVVGDRPDDGTYRHGDVYLAKQFFFLSVLDDLVDLLEVAHLHRNDLFFDLFAPEGDGLLEHDIMKGQVG